MLAVQYKSLGLPALTALLLAGRRRHSFRKPPDMKCFVSRYCQDSWEMFPGWIAEWRRPSLSLQNPRHGWEVPRGLQAAGGGRTDGGRVCAESEIRC